jgi:small conductance mechanosensitive channel
VVIRFVVKTRPLKQWPVKRELLRRIKNRFDQVGIAIPYPHRTVYHKFPDGQPHSADEAFAAAVRGG